MNVNKLSSIKAVPSSHLHEVFRHPLSLPHDVVPVAHGDSGLHHGEVECMGELLPQGLMTVGRRTVGSDFGRAEKA